MEQRVLIHTPVGKDAHHVCQVLTRANIEFFVCKTSTQVIQELENGAAALLMVEEALSIDFLKSITQLLQKQKAWSDLPILLLCTRGLDSPELRSIYQRLGNVTLIERPLQIITLVTTVKSAIRARNRQYEVREVDRHKDEFLAMLAHELRNPLAPISAASQILKLADLNRERTNRTSEIILRQVGHMTGLIDDLLDLSRVSRGLIELESATVNMHEIVTNAVEQVSPLIVTKSHCLEVKPFPDNLLVKGDLKRLIQILSNLLNNSAKYTPDNGAIRLEVGFDEKSVVISVSDNGLGIDPELIGSLFDMFTQAKRSSDRTQGGLGIGLALVKNLVELHDGMVTAESLGLGFGSVFTVTLPRLEGDMRPTEILDVGLPFQRKSKRVLLVDDNFDAADTLGMYLEALGFQVFIENSATSGLETFQTEEPDICLLDIGLPDMDGNELAKKIRARPNTDNVLLVAITGYGQELDRLRTTDSGFNHHFVKPVKIEDLLKVLNDAN